MGRRDRSVRFVVVGALVVALCGLAAGSAAAASMPNHHQMTALYVIDHNGKSPKSDVSLRVYSRPFQKILGGCRIGADDLTDMALNLAEQASYGGARNVTSLQMLQAIARRIVWKGFRPCGSIYNDAEAHQEAGDP